MRYKKRASGEWVQPSRAGFYFKCCECGIAHKLEFRLVPNRLGRGSKIQFNARRTINRDPPVPCLCSSYNVGPLGCPRHSGGEGEK